MSKSINRALRRSALSISLGLALTAVAGSALAQSAAGSVFGKTQAGATVIIENLGTGTSREIATDASGRFSATQLPTGRYRITSGGNSREVVVSVGTGTEVNLDAVAGDVSTLGAVEVTGSSVFNPIDVSSVESSTVFTAEQIRQLPVARDVTNVALLAPGTVKGDTGFGNVASFGGASPAENGYYINGFDVTNIFNFLSYASLPFDAISEQQVKTGGYGAEYGRSLGGVVSIVTKRGTNEWKGGASVYWEPEGLREQSRNVISRNPADLEDGHIYNVYREDNTADSLSYNVYGGGPIIKDHLFFFGLLEGRKDESDAYGDDNSSHGSNSQPRGMVKLDWNITDNQLLEFTGISNRSKGKTVTYANPDNALYTGEHGTETARYETESGGETYIGKYTGYLTENFTLSAMAGQLEIVTGDRDPALLGSEMCPRAYDSRANPAQVVKIGCWIDPAVTFVRDATQPPDRDERKSWRLDAEWHLGDHMLRFGYDHEKFASQRAGQAYTGGIYYRYYNRPADFNVNGEVVPANSDYVRTWDYRSLSGDFKVINTAAYLEDSWQVTDNVLLYGGLRSETFENLNGNGETFAKSNSLIAPRLGVSWDVKGDSTLKVFGNAGRYYIPIAANSSVRLAGGDNTAQNFYYYSGEIDPVTGAPVGGLGAQIGPNDDSVPVAPDSRTVAATNLKPMFQDEFIAGIQKDFGNHWTAGVRAIYRQVQNGMDDYCSHQPFLDWAEDNGHDNFDPDSLAGCMLINPGRDLQIAVDLESDGNLQVVTIPKSYFGLPDYKRKYRALEFFWEKSMADNWYLQGSYTYANSYGNVEGYVNSSLEQSDAGITQDFDNALFERGAYGPLPNDRRHTIKVFGVYELNDEWSVGGSLLAQSGRPMSCQGYLDLEDPSVGIDYDTLDNYSASTFYCPDAQGNPVLGHRGNLGRTPWIYSLDTSLGYTPNWANKRLTLEMKVFNVFNVQRVTEYNETSQMGGAAAPETNPNYRNIVNYQTPRSVLLSARYEF